MLDFREIGVEWVCGIFTCPPIFNVYNSKKVKTFPLALFICEIFDVWLLGLWEWENFDFFWCLTFTLWDHHGVGKCMLISKRYHVTRFDHECMIYERMKFWSSNFIRLYLIQCLSKFMFEIVLERVLKTLQRGILGCTSLDIFIVVMFE